MRIRALSRAAIRTGQISKRIASSDTITNKTNATAAGPIKSRAKKQRSEIARIERILAAY